MKEIFFIISFVIHQVIFSQDFNSINSNNVIAYFSENNSNATYVQHGDDNYLNLLMKNTSIEIIQLGNNNVVNYVGVNQQNHNIQVNTFGNNNSIQILGSNSISNGMSVEVIGNNKVVQIINR
ncbi:hypothetical protein [Faecalibacter bovis]|uniref:Curlin associated repeat-containing protein n=1 Tax=Faecalibacter bovis TaxID=2898187 RepID=A0ABX7XBM0_9FLAO|nr:hypothetical protein [Faecalibacter bovis]MBS7334119.1 hypothetical protein [Weeksellaceae bacterium]QTV05287.1 hypothetical protein J9309_10945 [Faecalibacter bovis]